MILVFGDGLLGSGFKRLKDAAVLPRSVCDITDRKQVYYQLKKYKPEAVVNCAGVVPKAITHVEQAFKVNGSAPHYLVELANCHVVQVSTNCVFPRTGGPFPDTYAPDPEDVYGYSKWLGELTEDETTTIRTSFVGLPDPAGRGLLAWASQQQVIIGYDKVRWNGVTVPVLVNKILDILNRRWYGLLHVVGPDTTKYDLLETAKQVFGWDVQLLRDSVISRDPVIEDRRLKTIYPRGRVDTTVQEMLMEMRDHVHRL